MRTKWIPLGLLITSPSLALASLDDAAAELLAKCMMRTLNVNVRAIVWQSAPWMGEPRQVKLEQSRSGKSRISVIAPIADQGVEFVDDGNKTVAYYPDTKSLVVRDSHRMHRRESMGRMLQVAEKNYNFESQKATSIAGRPVTLVTARPKQTLLPTRRFSIDTETGFLLRLEVSQPGERPKVYFDTLSVTYPAKIEEPSANLNIPDTKVTRDDQEGGKRVSLEPLTGGPLPMGFTVIGQEMLCGEDESIAVRISDGLVRGTIYQYKISGKEPKVRDPHNASTTDLGERRVVVVADISPEAREKFLDWMRSAGPFAAKAERSFDNGRRYGTFRNSKTVPNF